MSKTKIIIMTIAALVLAAITFFAAYIFRRHSEEDGDATTVIDAVLQQTGIKTTTTPPPVAIPDTSTTTTGTPTGTYTPIVKDIISQLATNGSYPTRTLDKITKAIVHCSAVDNQDAYDYARYHVNSRKWQGIGYHRVIEADGTIHLTQPLTIVSNHVSGQNTASIGYCISGDIDKHQPTAIQMLAIAYIIKQDEQQLRKTLSIEGHKQYSTKTCPGNKFPMQQLKVMVRGPYA